MQDRRRRGALHLRMGPRLPPRLPADRRGRRGARPRPARRLHRDRHRGGACRHRPAAGAAPPLRGGARVRPSQPPPRRGAGARREDEAGADRAARRPRWRPHHRLRGHPRPGHDAGGAARAPPSDHALPRRARRRGAVARPGALRLRRGASRGHHQRLRDGRRHPDGAPGHPRRPAPLARGVLPAGGAGGARRPARGLRRRPHRRRPAAARVLHRDRAPRRGDRGGGAPLPGGGGVRPRGVEPGGAPRRVRPRALRPRRRRRPSSPSGLRSGTGSR